VHKWQSVIALISGVGLDLDTRLDLRAWSYTTISFLTTPHFGVVFINPFWIDGAFIRREVWVLFYILVSIGGYLVVWLSSTYRLFLAPCGIVQGNY